MMLTTPPFVQYGAAVPLSPVVLSVPHAGRAYPAACKKLCRVPLAQLVRLEDRYADLLVQDCVAAGMTVLVAHTPRLWIDLNRDERDMLRSAGATSATRAPTSRARSGLGLVPTRLSGVGDIWWDAPNDVAIAARLAQVHRPYHNAVRAALAAARARFGIAILLDVHSMPPLTGQHAAHIVIGDRFGQAAAPHISDCAHHLCSRAGFRVARNAPYAGAHMLDYHAAPTNNIHALQLEFDRQLYLDEFLLEPANTLSELQKFTVQLARDLGDATGRSFAIAAE